MKWRKVSRLIAAMICLGLVGFVCAAWFVAGMLVQSTNQVIGPPPSDFPAVEVKIESESGSKIAAWSLVSADAAATIILVHGIHADRRDLLSRAKLLRRAGVSVLMIDMQAHGESPGTYVTLGYLERHDVAAAVAYCRKTNPNQRIGIVGVSMGGAATLLASPLGVDAIVIESVFPTITDAVYNRISSRVGPFSHILAPALLCQLRPRLGVSPSQLRPIDKIASVNCPILIASGDLDQHTTAAETQQMFARAREPKELVMFPGAAHEDLFSHDPKKYEDEVISFFDEHLRHGANRTTASE